VPRDRAQTRKRRDNGIEAGAVAALQYRRVGMSASVHTALYRAGSWPGDVL
jgi:hypothetical protein